MVEIPKQNIPSIYAGLMEQIKVRIQASRESLGMADKRRESPFAYLHAEFCYLQIRRIAEILALAVVVAHNEREDFRTNALIGEWNADRIFGELGKLNESGFPKPFSVNKHDDRPMDVVIDETGAIHKDDLVRIYHKCNDMLHVGSLKRLIRKSKHYDIGEISKWMNQLIRLLDSHIILLPEMKASLIVQMAQGPEQTVICQMSSLVGEYPEEGSGHVRREYGPAKTATQPPQEDAPE